MNWDLTVSENERVHVHPFVDNSGVVLFDRINHQAHTINCSFSEFKAVLEKIALRKDLNANENSISKLLEDLDFKII